MVFMTQRKRSRLSPTQETDVWKRWKAGQSLHEIGRAFDKPHTSIRHLLLPRGGIANRHRGRPSNYKKTGTLHLGTDLTGIFCTSGSEREFTLDRTGLFVPTL